MTDHLREAKHKSAAAATVHGVERASVCAQLATAHALIALVERIDRVQDECRHLRITGNVGATTSKL